MAMAKTIDPSRPKSEKSRELAKPCLASQNQRGSRFYSHILQPDTSLVYLPSVDPARASTLPRERPVSFAIPMEAVSEGGR